MLAVFITTLGVRKPRGGRLGTLEREEEQELGVYHMEKGRGNEDEAML